MTFKGIPLLSAAATRPILLLIIIIQTFVRRTLSASELHLRRRWVLLSFSCLTGLFIFRKSV